MFKQIFFLVGAVVALSAMATSSYAQNPPGTPVLWLDATDVNNDNGASNPANGAPVTSWSDKSGNGNLLVSGLTTSAGSTDTSPTYVTSAQNGKPGIQFDGLNGLMDTTPHTSMPQINEDRRIFFVGIPTDNDHTPGNAGVNSYFSHGNPDNQELFHLFLFDSGGTSNIYENRIEGFNNDDGSGVNSFDVTTAPGAPTIIEVSTLRPGEFLGPTVSFYKDGALEGSPTLAERLKTQGDPPLATSELRVGRSTKDHSDWLHLETIVYNEDPTNGNGLTDRQAVGEYLALKWGINAYGVPEPSCLVLLLLGGTTLLLRRVRRC